MKAPTARRLVAVHRVVARDVPFGPLDPCDAIHNASENRQNGLANSSNERADNKVGVRLQRLLVCALVACACTRSASQSGWGERCGACDCLGCAQLNALASLEKPSA